MTWSYDKNLAKGIMTATVCVLVALAVANRKRISKTLTKRNAVILANGVRGYVVGLKRPEKRLELGAWIAVSLFSALNLLYPHKVDLARQLAADATQKRLGLAYAYVVVFASIVNPMWIFAAYSLFTQRLVELTGVDTSQLVFTDAIHKIEELRLSYLPGDDGYTYEFVRGIVKSLMDNVTLPIALLQVVHAAGLRAFQKGP